MRRLLLIRHAKSSWKHPELRDHQRPLNKRGRRDAPVMGQVLNNCQGLHLDAMKVSSAVRAVATAGFLKKELAYEIPDFEKRDDLYHASESELIRIIQKGFNSGTHTAAVVGHNPGIEALANRLLADNETLTFPTCAMAAIDFDKDNWANIAPGEGHLHLYEYPKKYTQ